MFDFLKYTEKKLVKEIREILANIEPELSVAYDPKSSRVSLSGGESFSDTPMIINLANLFVKMRNLKPTERLARLEVNLREFLSDHEFSTDELIASLALRVRTVRELAIRELYMQVHVGEPLDALVVNQNELLLELVSDRQESLRPMNLSTLERASVTKDDAFEIANATLARLTDLQQWQPVEEHIWRSSYSDDYDFARVVSAGVSLRLPSDEKMIFYAPSHSVVLICDTQNQATLQKMIDFGDQASEDHRPLSKNFWHYTEESLWEKWLPESNASLAQLQAYKELIENYSEQKNILEKWIENNNEDSFVATYQVYKMESHYRSMCVYTLHLPSYLPKTEWVSVFDAEDGIEGSIVGELSWQAFVAAIGEGAMPEVSDSCLERFKLLSPLSKEQEKSLRSQAQ